MMLLILSKCRLLNDPGNTKFLTLIIYDYEMKPVRDYLDINLSQTHLCVCVQEESLIKLELFIIHTHVADMLILIRQKDKCIIR